MSNTRVKHLVWIVSLLGGAAFAAVSEEEAAKIEQAVPAAPAVQPQQPRKLLVLDLCGPGGFKHSSIPYWDKALQTMAAKTKAFEVTISSDMAVFSPETLKGYDAVCFNNTTKLVFTDDQKKALMDFVTSGKGIVGIHAATDNFNGWDEAAHMIGGQFTGHPWTSDKTVAVKIDDPDHPLTKPFGGKGFRITDEIYVTHPPFYGRDTQRVLLSLDMSDPNTLNVKGVTPEDYDTGISWIKSYGQGRVFYGSLGHNHPVTWNPTILAHYLAGIQFALGDLKADATPRPAPAQQPGAAALETLLQKTSGYDFGQGTQGLLAIEKTLRESHGTQADRQTLERALLKALQTGGTPAWKDFLCRQLSLVGSEASADCLVPMLKDEKTADMARYALERISGDKVRALVRQTLPYVPVKTQIGIISTLGAWRDTEAVGPLTGFLKGPDDGLRQAAASALGRIGDDASAKALGECIKDAAGPFRDRVLDARLQCAQAIARAGKTDQAARIFKEIYESPSQTPVRTAALAGWMAADRPQAGTILLTALQQPDQGLVVAACAMASAVETADQRRQVAEYLTKVPETGRVAMLVSLAQTRDRGLLPLVLSAAQKEKDAVQIAAVRALGPLGDDSVVAFLAATAASSTGELQRAARESLVQVRGEGVDRQILKVVQTGDAATQKELITAISARRIEGASDVLIRMAASQDSGVRRQALVALGEVGRQQDLPALVAMLLKDQTPELEDAIVAIARRIEDPSRRSDAVLAAMDSAKNPEARGAVLRVLGRLGSDKGLAILRKEIASSDPKIRTEAIRALAMWPTPAPLQDLWDVASSAADLTQQVLALRGYVNMVVMPSDVPAPQKTAMLVQAMAAAKRDEEKKLVLSVLPQCACAEALDLADSALANTALKAEAETAVVQVCQTVGSQYPDKAKAALNKVTAGTDNRSVRRSANQILGQLGQ